MKLGVWFGAAVLFVGGVCRAGGPAEVDLLSMGDWGRGNALQKEVAGAMAKYVQGNHLHVSGLLAAGDNCYLSLASTTDPTWRTFFEDVYDPKLLDFPFYIALGNHDYVNPSKELAHVNKARVEFDYAREHPESRWKLPANWYRVDFPDSGRPLVSVLILNSNRQQLNDAQWAEELLFIDKELGDRRGAVWMLACAHHPLFSNGAHGDNGVLKTAWGPLFQRHHLDFYLAGHDHDLQQLQIPEFTTSFLMVGGGGATTRPMLRDNRGPFSDPHVGFTHVRLTPELATVTYVSGLDGSVLHEFTRTPGGELKVLRQGPVVRATSRPLQTIQGLDQKRKKAQDD